MSEVFFPSNEQQLAQASSLETATSLVRASQLPGRVFLRLGSRTANPNRFDAVAAWSATLRRDTSGSARTRRATEGSGRTGAGGRRGMPIGRRRGDWGRELGIGACAEDTVPGYRTTEEWRASARRSGGKARAWAHSTANAILKPRFTAFE